FSGFSQELTVEKIWKEYAFFGKGVQGFRSMKDGERYTKRTDINNKDCIAAFRYASQSSTPEILVDLSSLLWNGQKLKIDDYEFNSDETKILFTTETESIYRRSFKANYFLYDLKSNTLSSLDEMHQPQMYANYSPDGTKVSYLFENNLYCKDLNSGLVRPITTDGERNKIINGGTDWVYEEEFSIAQAYSWSPDSKTIAFLRFDESKVKEFNLTYYGELYPSLYNYKYPKAGEDNSKVEVYIAELAKDKIYKIELGEYEYIPRLKWSNTNNTLVLQTLNRYQNHLKYHQVSFVNNLWKSEIFFEEKSKTYIDIDDNLLILKDGKTILRTSEANGFNHIYSVKFSGETKQITKGNWDVIEFSGIDESKGLIFYSSAEKGAIHKGVYSIKLDGTAKKALTNETGSNSADFSIGMKYFLKTYSNANTPPVFSLCDQKGKELYVLEDNKDLRSKLKNYTLSNKEFFQVQGATEKLNAWMIKPANFSPEKKYPVYINIYGGPGSNIVSDRWDGANYMYHQLLVQAGYIVVSIDPRGTMYRGADFKKSTYLQLGKLETEDFIKAAQELGQMDFVDKNRIGIQGWSYGGFMSSLCITKGAETFKMGIAVAPVTSWRYYDNIYTERFMRTPEENAAGYDDNSPINHVNLLKGKYLLIHGSTDDNVHYQNTMDMVNALVKADKQFDLFIYPNKNHGIYGGNTRNHLFKMMFNYTLQNL
ncbi:MAG: DPP IV N-terminal domain-containing protein, partial [Bacteroidetes bacterium]|nr:DPP IV N-terminal domain-containing protein [Bacteroidota bacterium]